MRQLLSCLFIAIVANCAMSARILAVLPIGSRSHQNMFQGVLKALAARGHQVVNYSPYPLEEKMTNYTDILLDVPYASDIINSLKMLEEIMHTSSAKGAKFLWDFSMTILENLLHNQNITNLIESDEKFDLVVLEAIFAQEALLAFGHRFNAPVINLHTFGAFSPINAVSGNSLALGYIPDYPLSFSNRMSFYERILNVYSATTSLHYYYSQYLPGQEAFARSMFKDPSMPPLIEQLHNISLFVNNINPYVHYSRPYTLNMVAVGGIHLSSERKPLPQVMKEFLDDGKRGVIYLSLGSILPDNLLPQQFFDNFINAFRRLPYKVLWKTKSNFAKLPGKIFTSDWTPQQDVLAHPNVVLFVTHGGMMSQHEVINAGVPVICIPFLGDQRMNAKFYESQEIGVKINFDELSEDTFYSAVTTVLSSSKYKDNMVRLSRIYRDQPTSPADRVVFWVEYVLRHGGALHLRPASSLMPWYRRYLVDIFVTAVVTVVVSILAFYFVIKSMLSLIFAMNDNVRTSAHFKKIK
ncbi:UDP-glycosyltransferase UGT5-like isoform X1 [Homalodisca vitripennis]|uniref:UDP-glycosyltransferase UGT5-like isoform X1 n=1 Tax=Homalodisca vitripennis TaxID=197043 RepID=UPI001EEAF8FF|nr:UDP-glycosyltransferase UGT5-like isoform X1 [Homalodisca vitripennis]XP_046659555.1 UDP-glycosyltransferase UGT5-like isoform X1 [Homalodisca vitripennis]XP_046659556.1 UDP-glycosyltransferase UGT5-like isoform X1 [Homalodisca vitripennis]